MSEEVKENKMGVMPVNKLLITMALPMMVSMLIQSLYNIVDSIFVSKICEDALTAVSMAFPMQNLMIGLGSGIGIGTNALVSRSLGQKKPEAANKYAVSGIVLAGVGYLIFLVLGLTVVREFYILQGASEVITEYGTTYLTIVMVAGFGCFIQFIFERLLQATGRTVVTMITQTTGAIINIILDPILIFGLLGAPKMGIAGAAIATVAGQIIAGCMAFICNMKFNKDLRISFIKYKPALSRIKDIVYIGFPSVVMVAVGSVMTFSVDKILVVFSSTAVAVFGIYFKLNSFAFMPIFGLNNGMIPIIGYNYGAKKPDRIKATLKSGLIFAEIIMLLFLVVVQMIPGSMLSLFSASEEMLSIGIPALRIVSISFVFAGICVVTGSYFQALGSSYYSLIISVVRQLLLLVPLCYFFSRTGNLNLVWWAWPIAELSSLALTIIFQRRVNRKIVSPLYEKQ